jgi:nucleoside phosphorylase
MSKRLIVFATKEEAKDSLELLHAQPQEGSSSLYTFNEGLILICGMGMLSAAACLSRCISQVDEVWNLGIAGALHDSLEVGTVYPIHTASAYFMAPHNLDNHSKEFYHNLYPSLDCSESKGRRLVSVAFPIHQQTSRDLLAGNYDLVDMEGYGIAHVAQSCHKPCFLWKLVSDFASEKTQGLIKLKMKHYSVLLAEAISKMNRELENRAVLAETP